ncbi:helix-turn-helix domain-containing protein [Effusibacillus pohliae]|uniref:helix-turn-helix domain-containing protein n=1 Tax=Effusibacillus pohliae TaxID=232270 RepID=UPI00036A589B|nr:helix-turn-helix transcriptional regulator [Effusibacillus pohliae]
MLAKRLSMLRGTKTQQEVADALGISRARYAHYESGRNEPDLDTLVRLADYYHVSLDYLLGRSDILKEEKEYYKIRLLKEAREIAELFQQDPDSHKFWLAYKKASPEQRKNFLRTWNIMMQLDKKQGQ